MVACTRRQHGFTLIELIVVIAITGIIAGMVAMFIRTPIQGYLATAQRAELVDIADTALLRIARDVRAALPNSVRVTQSGGVYYLEFLPLQEGGRYREAQDSTATCASSPDDDASHACDVLQFSATDTSLAVLGPAVTVQAGQFVAVYNLGIPGSDAWAGDTLTPVNAAGSSACAGSGTACQLAFDSFQFPLESPSRRFYLVGAPVTYVCTPGANGSGNLRRVTGYGNPSAAQPTSFAAATSNALLASRIQACRITYDPGASERLGQLTLWLQITQGDSGESVSIYREVAVNNDA